MINGDGKYEILTFGEKYIGIYCQKKWMSGVKPKMLNLYIDSLMY